MYLRKRRHVIKLSIRKDVIGLEEVQKTENVQPHIPYISLLEYSIYSSKLKLANLLTLYSMFRDDLIWSVFVFIVFCIYMAYIYYLWPQWTLYLKEIAVYLMFICCQAGNTYSS